MSEGEPKTPVPQPIVFGEVLFDCFPQGETVLGGAPFNVAWHLQGLGQRPILISRVGKDDLGERGIDVMLRWGMALRGVQQDDDLPTGRVEVTFVENQPSYRIHPTQAYDNIDVDQARDALDPSSPALLYHGSLALRAEPSRPTLIALRDALGATVFFDVNLRPPWWKTGQVKELLLAADWVKANSEEALALTGLPVSSTERERMRGLERLVEDVNVERFIMTRGHQGAALIPRLRSSLWEAAEPVHDLVDTVGAGDGFSAVCCYGILADWPLETILQRATAFAAQICRIRGATTEDRELYRATLDAWKRDDGIE